MTSTPNGLMHQQALGPLDLDSLSPADGRRALRQRVDMIFDRFGAAAEPTPIESELRAPVTTADRIVDGPGREVRIRLHHPRPGVALPWHVLLHGGGWAMGSIDEAPTRHGARHRACGADVAVATIDYSLAPEHPWPTALEDINAALRFLADPARAAELGLIAEALSIEGASAGANLTAAVVVSDPVVRPRGILLDVPALDLTGATLLAADAGLDLGGFETTLANYTTGHDRSDPRISPLLAPDLSGFPPTWLFAAEHDPLRHDAIAFAARLEAAQVVHRLTIWPGAHHDSSILTGAWDIAHQWQSASIAAIAEIHSGTADRD